VTDERSGLVVLSILIGRLMHAYDDDVPQMIYRQSTRRFLPSAHTDDHRCMYVHARRMYQPSTDDEDMAAHLRNLLVQGADTVRRVEKDAR